MSKATNFKYCSRIHRIDWNTSALKISGKAALENFRGTHI